MTEAEHREFEARLLAGIRKLPDNAQLYRTYLHVVAKRQNATRMLIQATADYKEAVEGLQFINESLKMRLEAKRKVQHGNETETQLRSRASPAKL